MNYFKNLVYKKLNFDEEKIAKINTYISLVLEYNQSMNLTGFDEETIWKDGIYDSILYLENAFLSPENLDLVDIGAGAGFPSVPFLIFKGNNFNLSIIESLQKRINFLEIVKQKLDLNLSLYNQRVELFKEKKFDLICARAVAPLNTLLEISSHLGKINSKYAFIKSKNIQNEIKNSNFIIDALKIKYSLLELPNQTQRNNVIFSYIKKSENTKFPRKWTIIKSEQHKRTKQTKNS